LCCVFFVCVVLWLLCVILFVFVVCWLLFLWCVFFVGVCFVFCVGGVIGLCDWFVVIVLCLLFGFLCLVFGVWCLVFWRLRLRVRSLVRASFPALRGALRRRPRRHIYYAPSLPIRQ